MLSLHFNTSQYKGRLPLTGLIDGARAVSRCEQVASYSPFQVEVDVGVPLAVLVLGMNLVGTSILYCHALRKREKDMDFFFLLLNYTHCTSNI